MISPKILIYLKRRRGLISRITENLFAMILTPSSDYDNWGILSFDILYLALAKPICCFAFALKKKRNTIFIIIIDDCSIPINAKFENTSERDC